MNGWSEFEDDYLRFIEWEQVESKLSTTEVHILSEQPEAFINKWGREQYRVCVHKVQVDSETTTKSKIRQSYSLRSENIFEKFWLAGGKKLFRAIKPLFVNDVKYIKLFRLGTGFDTEYEAYEISLLKQQKIDENLN